MIAALVQLLLCLADLGHCTRIANTAGGLRCVEVTLAPSCPFDQPGFHLVLGTPVCTHDCGAGGRASS